MQSITSTTSIAVDANATYILSVEPTGSASVSAVYQDGRRLALIASLGVGQYALVPPTSTLELVVNGTLKYELTRSFNISSIPMRDGGEVGGSIDALILPTAGKIQAYEVVGPHPTHVGLDFGGMFKLIGTGDYTELLPASSGYYGGRLKVNRLLVGESTAGEMTWGEITYQSGKLRVRDANTSGDLGDEVALTKNSVTLDAYGKLPQGNLPMIPSDKITVNNTLTSYATNVPLSAYQGNNLNNSKVAKADYPSSIPKDGMIYGIKWVAAYGRYEAVEIVAGGGGSGGVDLSNYQGHVRLIAPSGSEIISTYRPGYIDYAYQCGRAASDRTKPRFGHAALRPTFGNHAHYETGPSGIGYYSAEFGNNTSGSEFACNNSQTARFGSHSHEAHFGSYSTCVSFAKQAQYGATFAAGATSVNIAGGATMVNIAHDAHCILFGPGAYNIDIGNSCHEVNIAAYTHTLKVAEGGYTIITSPWMIV